MLAGKAEIKKSNLVFFILASIGAVILWPHPESSIVLIAGSLVISAACFLVIFLFLANFNPDVLKIPAKTLFILLLILSFLMLVRLALSYPDRNLLPAIPFALVPVIICTFYDPRLATFILLFTVILASFFMADPFEFAFINYISGLMAVFTMASSNRKRRYMSTAFVVAVSYSVLFTSMTLMTDGNLAEISGSEYLLFAGNGLLVLFSYPIIYIFEKRFKFLSDATLLELSDTNQPLLRKLADEAPGSFQHSLQVANLAEEAARVAGANPLLARAGALYHDIGKIAGPGYYAENQKNGESPHEDLDPLASARIIIDHVRAGMVLARNFRLPSQLIDFIETHHGTSVAYYFFKKYTDKHSWDISKEREFAYPGPKPFSRETAIVMMADAIEASSRSLEHWTDENISELVERIILLQEQDGQYSEVPFTYKDISDIKATFKKRLSTMYHVRISYPERLSS
jgi:cyclic-di-AMP phosphodiesterase PgpH